MCGVIGLRCAKDRQDLGVVASRLLRMCGQVRWARFFDSGARLYY